MAVNNSLHYLEIFVDRRNESSSTAHPMLLQPFVKLKTELSEKPDIRLTILSFLYPLPQFAVIQKADLVFHSRRE